MLHIWIRDAYLRSRARVAVVGVALVALLTVLAACSDGGGAVTERSVAGGLIGRHGAAPPVAAAESAGRSLVGGASYIAAVQRSAGAEHAFETRAGGAVARTPSQGFRVEISDGALALEGESAAAEWFLELRWSGIGRPAAIRPVGPPVGGVEVVGNRATYRRADGSEEWYLNGPLGVEQGFALAERPAGEGELVLELLASGLAPRSTASGASVRLADGRGRSRLRYGDLFAVDALGRELPAWLEVVGAAISVRIDDSDAVYPLDIDPLIFVQRAKLTASDGGMVDYLGRSVTVSCADAIVGAYGDDDRGANSGAAYVFVRSAASSWVEDQKLTAADGTASDHFGRSVSMSGDRALVGASGDSAMGTSSGSVYVFERSGTGSWVEHQKLYASDAGNADAFGSTVSVSGDRGIVGAAGNDDYFNNRGSAYLFERAGSGSWTESQKITAADGAADDRFGAAVGIDGDFAIIGAPFDDDAGTDSGSAYVFERSGTGSWVEHQKLTATDGAAGDRFGDSVTIDGDFAIVGAHFDMPDGSAYVFERGGTGVWLEQHKLTAPPGGAPDSHVASVALSVPYAVVGVAADLLSGSAYLFEWDGSSSWLGPRQLIPSVRDWYDGFGNSVAVAGSCATVLVGAHGDSDNGHYAGAAYLYDNPCRGQPDGTACDDGFLCNGTDSCQSESCVPVGTAASDGTPCDDGLFCNGTETCTSGVCGSSTGDPCAGTLGDADDDCSESCDERDDTCTAEDADGSACSDGQFCNGTETCTGGTCGGSSGDPCAANLGDLDDDCSESCDETEDDCSADDLDGSYCDDGAFCNGTETCTAGVCGGSAGDPCPGADGDSDCSETCDETGDECSADDLDGSPCPNGSCSGGMCVVGSGGAAGTGGSGTGGSATAGTGGELLGDDNVGQGVDQGGCGCRLVPRRSESPSWALLGLLTFGGALARRRRRLASERHLGGSLRSQSR